MQNNKCSCLHTSSHALNSSLPIVCDNLPTSSHLSGPHLLSMLCKVLLLYQPLILLFHQTYHACNKHLYQRSGSAREQRCTSRALQPTSYVLRPEYCKPASYSRCNPADVLQALAVILETCFCWSMMPLCSPCLHLHLFASYTHKQPVCASSIPIELQLPIH